MKTLLIVAAALVVIVVSLRAAFQRGPGSLSVKHNDTLESLPCGTQGAKKALIVYQPSGTGSTYRVVKSISRRLNDAGYDVVLNTPGSHLPTDLSEYDLVALGTPVYAGQISSVLTDYAKIAASLPADKTVLFSVGGVDDAAPELAPLRDAIKDVKNPLLLKFNYKDDNRNDKPYKALVELATDQSGLS